MDALLPDPWSLPPGPAGWLALALLGLALAGCAQALLAAALVGRFSRRPPPPAPARAPGVLLLKPLHGEEPGLARRLGSFLNQDYPGRIEARLGLQDAADPALPLARALARAAAARPGRAARAVLDRSEHGANRKVSNLVNLARAGGVGAEVVILSDSDVTAPPDLVARLVAELDRPGVGAVTLLYHGEPEGPGPWPRLSAMAIDGHFLPNVVTGLALGLARPCFGSAIALRAETLAAIGGFERVADALADDHALGAAVRGLGLAVAVPGFTVGHACPEGSLKALWRHERRWARTIRAVDPAGYAGSVVTHPVALATLGALASALGAPALANPALGVLGLALACRLLLAVRVERAFGLAPAPRALVPVREALSFAVFLAGLAGGVEWRGRAYRVARDGTMSPAGRAPARPAPTSPAADPSRSPP